MLPLVDLLPDACMILLPGLLLPEGKAGWLAAACARMYLGMAGACSGWAACLLPSAFTGSGERDGRKPSMCAARRLGLCVRVLQAGQVTDEGQGRLSSVLAAQASCIF